MPVAILVRDFKRLFFSMHLSKQRLLTTILCGLFIFIVFYGDLLEYPSRRVTRQIQTVQLDVRLDNLSPNVPDKPLSDVKLIQTPLDRADVLENNLKDNDSEDRLFNFEVLPGIEILKDAHAPPNSDLIDNKSSDVHNESSPSSNGLERHFMIFLVPSTPNSLTFRHSMRTKWLNQSCWRRKELKGIDPQYFDFKLMFIIGTDSKKNYSNDFLEELSQNNDMFLMKIPESRKILKKKVLFGMKESIKRFDYDFLIKFDHDTMVDLPRLGSGVSKLSKKNLFTGSCRFGIKPKKLDSRVNYCSGGAYILSRDVVQKIAALSEAETNISLGGQEPEDVYTGLLVRVVREKFKITELWPKFQKTIVNRYGSINGRLKFKTWFVHRLKGWRKMDRAFNCRVGVDLDSCPSEIFFYENENSTQCVCRTVEQ